MSVDVPVKLWLPADVYRELDQHARVRGLEGVGALLAVMARASLKPRRRKYTRITDEMVDKARYLRDLGYSWRELGETLGCSGKGLQLRMERES